MIRLLLTALLVTGCTAKVSDESERRRGNTLSTYDVWDFEFVSAPQMVGRTLRIAAVNDRIYRDPIVEVEGSDGLDDYMRGQIPVGQMKRFEFSTLKLKSIYGDQTYEITSMGMPIVANVRHVRSCNVSIEQKEKTQIVGDSSKGIITVPKLKTSNVRSFSSPPCADPSDRTVEQKRIEPLSAEMVEAQKKSAAELAERELKQKIALKAQAYDAEFEKRAGSAGFLNIPADPLHQEFCPRTAALMTAADVPEISFARVETKHEQHQGYTEIAYASSMILKPRKGPPVSFEDSRYSEAARNLKSLKLDPSHCLAIESTQTPQELRKVVEEINDTIKRYVSDLNYERAEKELRH